MHFLPAQHSFVGVSNLFERFFVLKFSKRIQQLGVRSRPETVAGIKFEIIKRDPMKIVASTYGNALRLEKNTKK